MLASRSFDSADQTRFAALTGDYNPIHLDPVVARRTRAGAPIVHGIHALLWLLDTIAARHPEIGDLVSLNVRFEEMIYVGDRIDAELSRLTADTLRARVCADGVGVITVSAKRSATRPSPRPHLYAPVLPHPTEVHELSLEDITDQSGELRFSSPAAGVQREFPHAALLFGERTLAVLCRSSCLVGMIVPGLHSVYGGLELRFTTDSDSTDELRFRVLSVDQRFRRVLLGIEGGGLEGVVEAYCRAPPVMQPPISAIAHLVASDEFRNVVALVVGGSRGLGEITAKLAAAGGARVVITYATGKADAERLAQEIKDWGGWCDVLAYDVRLQAQKQLQNLAEPPTHLYYFATPPIVRRKPDIFARDRLDEFNEFYLDGFIHLIDASLRLRPEGITAFYPSTVAIDDRPAKMTEYAMSKAAGEVLCADIARYRRGVRIITRRLPRVGTDQTASLIDVGCEDALSVMLPIVREMHHSVGSGGVSVADHIG
jgi:acyl dehydratase/NAD(P)-dependent dehydrogenase (short-subunit alcohol dehydrogenase family)